MFKDKITKMLKHVKSTSHSCVCPRLFNIHVHKTRHKNILKIAKNKLYDVDCIATTTLLFRGKLVGIGVPNQMQEQWRQEVLESDGI